jgi:signal transduction histidine kinase
MMALVTGWIAHRISLRIRRLQQQVGRIAAGDFQQVDPGDRRDEVTELAGSINQMSAQLKRMRHTIVQSERARLLAQLAAGLAHQLRNSLTGARMSVQLYLKRHPAAAGDETLQVALRQLMLTEEHVKGLLSAGRVEHGPTEVSDLHQIVTDVAGLVDPACQHARVDLNRVGAADDGPLEIIGDRSSLRAAILNITLNAIEAAGPGGKVSLGARARTHDLTVEVTDTGPGPPLDLADHLDEPFVTSKSEGVGLGLALARQVANDHGGRLSWSRAEAITRFTLSFPRTNRTPPGEP